MRKTLCEYKNEHPSSSKKVCNSEFNKHLISLLANQQYQILLKGHLKITNSNVKKHKLAKYPELEKVLYEWFLQYQEKVNMNRKMIQIKAKEFLQKMYGDANSEFNFSIGWLEQFTARHGIKSYRRFGESGSVDIYNMDETDLFYCLQADHSLINVLDAIHFINVAWNIDVKPTTIANCFRHCKIRSEEDMPIEQEIGNVEGIHKLKEVISYLHYRNAMDIEQILNYPSEN
ncbi:hypothetical protein CXB51_024499 [Gossypium anomalum]|uniref:HTH CENPB-type domain-containing protein n=1 Tax=Gossypium anomalum TaxID=47600 RepID=A0A8J5YQB5_9ROSI|nr:hypothetical protein CXB51_024499 [Gossypium anomalum]